MALKKTVTTIHGFEAVNAYHRVEEMQVTSKSRMTFKVASYRALTAEEEAILAAPVELGKPAQGVFRSAFERRVHEADYDINGVNPFAQAYAFVKSLPEFAGAEDC